MPSSPSRPHRLLLKLSGEMLQGHHESGIDHDACSLLAKTLCQIRDEGYELGVVIGGGNIFRGLNLKEKGMQRSPADQIGMLATLMNGLAMQQALQAIDCKVAVLTALECPKVAQSYNWQTANELLSTGTIVLFVGGTGNPYFTTDTAAALRASEIGASYLIKATKVDGVYSGDPKKDAKAIFYPKLTYGKVLTDDLKILDATAIALCRSNQIPVLVFNMKLLKEPRSIQKAISGEIGTLITENITT